jgi:hypothetical protein
MDFEQQGGAATVVGRIADQGEAAVVALAEAPGLELLGAEQLGEERHGRCGNAGSGFMLLGLVDHVSGGSTPRDGVNTMSPQGGTPDREVISAGPGHSGWDAVAQAVGKAVVGAQPGQSRGPKHDSPIRAARAGGTDHHELTSETHAAHNGIMCFCQPRP